MARDEKRKVKRQAIIAQCKHGEDDDLISWYQSLEKGTRQAEVMRLLRVALDLPQPKQSMYEHLSADDIEQLVASRVQKAIEDAKVSFFDEVMSKVDKTFDEMWGATQREIAIASNALDYSPKSASQYEPIPDKVADEILEQRRKNMQKDSW
mgnify:FL=1